VTGEVDRLTFDRMESVYNGIVSEINYEFSFGRIFPFPGRVIAEGSEGNDVRIIQEYLNYISNTYPSIPKVNVDGVFGPASINQVIAFKEEFGLPAETGRVNAVTWNAISNVYDDLYTGSLASEGQYPGYDLSASANE